MASKGFKILLSELMKNTEQRTTIWQETADENAYRIRIGDNIVRVEIYKPNSMSAVAMLGNISEKYRALLISSKGRTLDVITSDESSDLITGLYEAARASALNIDSITAKMLLDLRAGNFGEPKKKEEKE